MYLSSCYKEVPIDFENISPKLALSGEITEDSIISVYITASKFVADTNMYYINDAIVNLYSDGVFSEQLQLDSLGWYSSVLKAKVGIEYKVEVKHYNYENIFAKTTIPEKPIIDTCEFFYDFGPFTEGYDGSKITISLSDIQNQDNFYYIKGIFLNGMFITLSKPLDAVLLSEKELINGYLFTDNLFKNTQHDLVLHISRANRDTFFYDIKIQTVTEDFYKFYNSWTDYQYARYNNYFDFNTEPIEVYSNVQNGYGIFYGYNEKKYTISYIVTQ